MAGAKQQTTISRPVDFVGQGLHSGVECCFSFLPADADQGVIFRKNGEVIPAKASAVAETHLGTRIQNGGGEGVQTVEHVMAALAIAGIDNVTIDVCGPEAPAADGSAGPFVDVLLGAGLRELDAPRRALRFLDPFELRDGERFIRAEPFDGAEIAISIAFDEEAIGKQEVRVDLTDQFVQHRRLARARTFCRLKDIELMRSAGYSRGGSLDNAIVVDGAKVLNASGLRDPDEFALHKALDLLGDLRLLGGPFIGRITAHKCGHDLNTAFARGLLAKENAFEWVNSPATLADSLMESA